MNYRIIAVDFDGTLCYSNWPELGEPNMPLIEYLRTQKKSGDKLILWTCRAGEALERAVSRCRELHLEFARAMSHAQTRDLLSGSLLPGEAKSKCLYTANAATSTDAEHPEMLAWLIEKYGNNSRKITCDYYIDDKAVLPEAVRACG